MHYGEEKGIIEKNIYPFISMPVIHTKSELYDVRKARCAQFAYRADSVAPVGWVSDSVTQRNAYL